MQHGNMNVKPKNTYFRKYIVYISWKYGRCLPQKSELGKGKGKVHPITGHEGIEVK